ncbi:MAG: S41 family peptidase [Dehalococcoidales bacterium]|jgi:carboxyl-terminal processing protease|nr:S41 family peptidase [Dehalococcoidales bacterium]MDP6737922.1 S41 family peptidase [Dehalococcoidales bacterium]
MSKKMRFTVVTMLVLVSLVLSFSAGCRLASQATPSPTQNIKVVKEAWDIIFENYVDRTKLDPTNLSAEAIKGMVKALDDPYTTYMNPQTYKLSTSDFQGKFHGIGATVGLKDNKLTIIAPILDSPAAKAGIKPGDTILEINGQSTAGMSVEEAVSRIRGPKGTAIRLLIQHLDDVELIEIEIIRAEIKLPSVSFGMEGDIAYIKISYFTEYTNEELLPVLANVAQSGATGIILDLRSNPGGLLDTVVDVASHFIKEGIIVSTVDNQGRKESSSVHSDGTKTDLPMVVLTNNHSASGSEVLAGALQDYDRAIIAGTETYGKGSVNKLYRLEDGSGLYITIARWFTPNGRMIEGRGITPDYELDLKGSDAIRWALDFLWSTSLNPAGRVGG